MKRLRPLLFVLLAMLLGIGVAIYRIADYESTDVVFKNGSWMGSRNLPLGEDNLLTAQITLFALFALPGEEAVYMFAMRDHDKELLHSKNDYTITGNIHQIHSKYWSITMYGRDYFLVPNSEGRYGFNNQTLETDSAGNFTIHVSHRKQAGNWLPAPDNKRFNFLLRIYKGKKDYLERLPEQALPEIKRVKG